MARRAGKADAVPAEPQGQGPQRRCLVDGVSRPAEEMVRFVVAPDGMVVPDVAGRLPGRGFWLSARRDIVKTACAKKLFAKAARASVTVAPGLDDEIEWLLARRCLDLMGMARRAGQVVAGFEKVRAHLRTAKAGVLLAAADGAANGREKVAALAPEAPLIGLLSAAELGAALGREHVVHAVVAPGAIADKLRREAARLSGFRGGESSPTERDEGKHRAGRATRTD